MARNSSKMNTTHDEVRAVAKAIGASLKRQGHPVPHSNLLNAVAAALNQRNWATLRAKLAEATPSGPTAPVASPAAGTIPDSVRLGGLPRWTKHLLRLALVSGKPVRPLPARDEDVERLALAAIGRSIPGSLRIDGQDVPAQFDYTGARLVGGGPQPAMPMSVEFAIRLPKLHHRLLVEFSEKDGWVVPDGQLFGLVSRLAEEVSDEDLLAETPDAAARAQLGPEVHCVLGNDSTPEALHFDGRRFLSHAPDRQIEALLDGEFSTLQGSSAALRMASFMSEELQVAGVQSVLDELEQQGGDARVKVSWPALLRWLIANRPQPLARWLCEREAVRIVPRGSPVPSWDWVSAAGVHSAQPFESAREATMDAMVSLGLAERILMTAVNDARGR